MIGDGGWRKLLIGNANEQTSCANELIITGYVEWNELSSNA